MGGVLEIQEILYEFQVNRFEMVGMDSMIEA